MCKEFAINNLNHLILINLMSKQQQSQLITQEDVEMINTCSNVSIPNQNDVMMIDTSVPFSDEDDKSQNK